MTLTRIFVLLAALCCFSAAHADPRVTLTSPSVSLTEFQIGYFIDDSHALSYAQARKQTYSDTGNITTLGNNALVTWFKVTLDNATQQDLALDLQMPHAYHVKSIELYEEHNGQLVNTAVLDLEQAETSNLMYRGVGIYPMVLPAGHTTTLYVRSFAYSHQWFALNIFDKEHSKKALVGVSSDVAILVGMMLALVFYNFLLYFATSKKENIFYSFYLISGVIWIALSYGLFASLFDLYGEGVFMLNLSLVTMPLFLLLFMMAIFETKQRYPIEHRFLMAILLPLCVMFFWGLFDITGALKPAGSTAALMMLVTLSVSISLWYKGNPLAKFFVIGHGFFVFFNVWAVLFYKGVVAPSYLGSHGTGIGIMLEALMLAFIISYRIKMLEDLRESQDELKKQAATDPLTRLYNRRYFFAEAGYLLETAIAKQQPMTILAIDIDHFKQVNDAHGHAVGDQVLTTLAHLLKKQSRCDDLLARFGGEEFVLLLPQTDTEQALNYAERVRQAVAEQPIETSADHYLNLTVSIGVAAIELSNDNIESALNRADEALYEAKHNGRNQVCLSAAPIVS